jgi:hypothetical protein
MLWSVGYDRRPVFSRATTSAHTPSASEAGSTRADSASSPARNYANAPPMVAARSLAPGGSSITRYGWSPALAQAHPPRVLRRNGAQRTRRRHTSPTSPDTHTKICGNPRPPRRRRNQVSGCRVQGRRSRSRATARRAALDVVAASRTIGGAAGVMRSRGGRQEPPCAGT